MKYFIHDISHEPPLVKEVSREHMVNLVGSGVTEDLEETFSISCGQTIYEARPEKANSI